MAEKIATGIFFVLGVIWLVMSFSLASNNFGGGMGLGPDFFPRMLALMMIIFSTVHFFKLMKSPKEEEIKIKIFRLSAYIFAACVAYLALVGLLGYIVTTFLYISLTIYLISRKKSLLDMVAALVVTLCLYGVFHLLLHVPLPEGFFI